MQRQHQWTLGLAVGNGGALAALAAKCLNDLSQPVVGLVFPSMILFAVGLGLAGSTPALDILQLDRQADRVVQSIADLESDPKAQMEEFYDVGLWSELDRWKVELASAAAFGLGVAYPLFVLLGRYLRHGNFAGS